MDLGAWDADELFDPAADRDEDREPTSGERLLYALRQLYRLFRHGALNVHWVIHRPELTVAARFLRRSDSSLDSCQ